MLKDSMLTYLYRAKLPSWFLDDALDQSNNRLHGEFYE